jgi:Na+/H+ antiporter NhaD/arsenite permease-like protein
MFVGIFVVSHGMESAGWTAWASGQLSGAGIDLTTPATAAPVVAVLSNLVSNVPAVVMVEPYVGTGADTGHVVALASTIAGNALIVGSIANIIVVEQAKRMGVVIGAGTHARVGVPVTVVSILIAVLWAWLAW